MLEIRYINDGHDDPKLVAAVAAALRTYANERDFDETPPGKSIVGTATGPGTSTETQTSAPAAVGGRSDSDLIEELTKGREPLDDVERDEKGVPFSAEFCGIAADPFYKKGNKRAGQWKKKQGVDDAAYEKWYAGELLKVRTQTATDAGGIDTAGAFSNDTSTTPNPETTDPTNAGELMVWVSELQGAERLTAEDLAASYLAAGFQADALFDPDATVVTERVATLLGHLKPKVKQ